jgi:membrane protease YdiL (CAAX protease family)
MIGVLVVLAFPVITMLGFSAVAGIYLTRRSWIRMLDRHSLFWYPVFLLVPIAAIIASTWGAGPLARIGVGLPAGPALPVWILAALALAGGLFFLEIASTWMVDRLSPSLPFLASALAEGRANSMLSFQPGPLGWVLCTVVFVWIEEFVWRGYLITQLGAWFGWGVGLAIVVSSLAFGTNHYYFGLRNVALKSLEGAAWGLLYVASGSIWLPILSHFAFALLVVRELRREHVRVQVGASGD